MPAAPPSGVLAVGGIAACMALNSLVLVSLPTPAALHAQGEGLSARWAISSDTIALQNMGHAAFLVCFALSWWRGANALGNFMVQLSSLLLAFPAAVYALVASGVPRALACLLLAASCTALSHTTQMDPRLSILSPGLYRMRASPSDGPVGWYEGHSPVRAWSIWLRRLLLAQALAHGCWLAAAAWDRGWLPSPAALPWALAAPAAAAADAGCVARAFVESYTMSFHQAFILGTGYSQGFTDTPENRPTALHYFVAGCAVQVASLAAVLVQRRAAAAPSAESWLLWATLALPALAAGAALGLLRSLEAAKRAATIDAAMEPAAEDKLGPRPDPIARPPTPPPADQVETAGACGTALVWPTLARLALVPASRVPADLAALHHTVRHAWWATVANAVLWQAQGILALAIDAGWNAGAHGAHDGTRALAASMKEGINWAMHGAGISVFTAALALWQEGSWPYLRAAVVLGALGGSVQGLAQVVRLAALEGLSLAGGAVGLVAAHYGARALVGVHLAVAFGALPASFHHDAHRLLAAAAAPGPLARGSGGLEEARAPYAPGRPASRWLATAYTCAAVLYALWVSSFLRGRPSAAPTAGEECPADTCVSAWRVGASPPAYTLLFHFAYLLTSFAVVGADFRHPPSAAVGYAFTLSALVIAAAQCTILAVVGGEAAASLLPPAAVLVPGSLAMLIKLRQAIPVFDAGCWMRPSDRDETSPLVGCAGDDPDEDSPKALFPEECDPGGGQPNGRLTASNPRATRIRYGFQSDFW